MKRLQFKFLLKSEIKKAEVAANKFYGRNDCRITGYSSHLAQTEFGVWYDVTCEICFHYEERADHDVLVSVFMDDRRRSFAVVKTW